MKLRLVPIVLMLAATAVLANEPAAIALGATAPKADVKTKNVDGTEVSIADVRGPKGTLVIFTCNHCPFVKQWETRIVDLGNAGASQGIGVIAVNANDPKANAEDGFEAMQQRAKDRGMKFPYVVDASSGVARAFGASRTPEAFLFDKDGKLVYHGAIDDNGEEPAIEKYETSAEFKGWTADSTMTVHLYSEARHYFFNIPEGIFSTRRHRQPRRPTISCYARIDTFIHVEYDRLSIFHYDQRGDSGLYGHGND